MKLDGDEVCIKTWRKVGEEEKKMVGPKSNGIHSRNLVPTSAPPSAPASVAGSDCAIDFTKEDVEALLNERMRTKNKFNYKERCEQMMDYIRRLRLCIKWFQEIEGGYLLEQENLREMVEFVEKKCNDMGEPRQHLS
ncbi:hypothetical protein V2J09_017259 [Rumex salicifolius]